MSRARPGLEEDVRQLLAATRGHVAPEDWEYALSLVDHREYGEAVDIIRACVDPRQAIDASTKQLLDALILEMGLPSA